jgi:adenylosuccinate synthase
MWTFTTRKWSVFYVASKLMVVVGGQYGSEGKGAVAAYLTHPDRFEGGMAIRVAGPNAGHSAIGVDGQKYALRQLPVAAVTNPNAKLVIAAGSEIDPQVLWDEVQLLEGRGFDVLSRLTVDESATVIEEKHRLAELNYSLVTRLGSTGKGIGAARADRAMRGADTAISHTMLAELVPLGNTARLVTTHMGYDNLPVLIEGTQGYGLGLHTWHYPKTTSSDCRAVDFLAMAGISPWASHVNQFQVWVCVRPFPIRVAGPSGWLKEETTWEDLGLAQERTTVTQKIRRVGRWDSNLAREAILANGGPAGAVRVALTMGDQLDNRIEGLTEWNDGLADSPVWRFVRQVQADTGTAVSLLGTGPGTMIDLSRFAQ